MSNPLGNSSGVVAPTSAPVQPVNAPGGNVFNQSANALTAAGGALNSTVQPGAIASSMNTYMSPYISNVINDSVGRLRDRRNIDLNTIKGNAAQSGAFGGSRQGLIEADTIDNYGRAEDELVSRLLQGGFDTSAGLATAEQGLMQSGAQGLMGLGGQAFGIGQQTQAGQMQAGTAQQQLLQSILSGASNQFDGYMGAPTQVMSTLLSALSGNPLSGNNTGSQTFNPGLFNYLSMGAGVAGSGK